MEGDSITPNPSGLSSAARELLKKSHEVKLDPMGACRRCPWLWPSSQYMAAPSYQRHQSEQASVCPSQQLCRTCGQFVTSPLNVVAKP